MTNHIYMVDPIEIVGCWQPGDYMPPAGIECNCYELYSYHKCDGLSLEQRWNRVLDIVYNDDRYEKILDIIIEQGFKFPLAAKYSTDGSIVLVDGHHRVSVALQLFYTEIPVFIAASAVEIFDLRAMDSGWWGS